MIRTYGISLSACIRTQVIRVLAHGLEAGLTVVEERAVARRHDNQDAVLGLQLAALDLCLQVAPALRLDRLNTQKSIKLSSATRLTSRLTKNKMFLEEIKSGI